MRGTATLKQVLAQSVILEELATHLREASNVDDLARTWFEECDVTPEGDVRDALRAVYLEMLGQFGVTTTL